MENFRSWIDLGSFVAVQKKNKRKNWLEISRCNLSLFNYHSRLWFSKGSRWREQWAFVLGASDDEKRMGEREYVWNMI